MSFFLKPFKCHIDTLKQVLENVLLIGGLACIPGLKARLTHGMKIVSERTLLWHESLFPVHIHAWIGGSLSSIIDGFQV